MIQDQKDSKKLARPEGRSIPPQKGCTTMRPRCVFTGKWYGTLSSTAHCLQVLQQQISNSSFSKRVAQGKISNKGWISWTSTKISIGNYQRLEQSLEPYYFLTIVEM